MRMFKVLISVAGLAGLLGACPANAAEGFLSAVPTAWRLQNYVPNGVTVYLTGVAGCYAGGLSMPATSTADDKNRFWSLIMTAKAANRSVYIFYEATTCQINSFGWLENG